MFTIQPGKIEYHFDAERLWLEGWGENGVRIRCTQNAEMLSENWALTKTKTSGRTWKDNTGAYLQNGKIIAHISNIGKITLKNQDGKIILEEYWRTRQDPKAEKCSALEVKGRIFQPILGGDYHIAARFESLNPNEKIYGMGQYQQAYLDLKGSDLELAHRNSQISIPFYVSSEGYGFLWNNPAIGRAIFGKNHTSFEAYTTKSLDYWVTTGDTPAEIVHNYMDMTGKPPMMPEYGLGFWQSKLRYQTQEELLAVAREYHKRGLPLDVIVIDFFHWFSQGDWKFDKRYWPAPKEMIDELQKLGIKAMISVWPTVEATSENYPEMLEKGYLIRTERGVRVGLHFGANTIHFDATNPEAREFLWNKIRENYYQYGIENYWLDEAEPEYSIYDFDNYRYHRGTNLEIGNIYPKEYARAFYEGQLQEGQSKIVNLLRCAWAGSQKYGALVWSGDIASSFFSMRNQLCAGLNMGLSGIPWWTTDIGGFHGGNPDDPAFRELLIRWFQWGAYCPVMRLHGSREPIHKPMGTEGGARCSSGSDNEVWSYGEEAYEICKKYLEIREKNRDYIRNLMQEAHETGSPLMRTLFYEFPEDKNTWEISDEYMFGSKYLVAPVLYLNARSREVYFPLGSKWKHIETQMVYEGGTRQDIPAPLDSMPVFEKIF